MTDANENIWEIYAYGIAEITSDLKFVNMSSYSSQFPQVKIEDINRPYGTIDMLVGIDCCAILPQVVETIGNIHLLRNQFGYCIRGCQSTYDNITPRIKEVKIARGTTIQNINGISVHRDKCALGNSNYLHFIGRKRIDSTLPMDKKFVRYSK